MSDVISAWIKELTSDGGDDKAGENDLSTQVSSCCNLGQGKLTKLNIMQTSSIPLFRR
jgi:hypothetical protein